MHKTTQPGVNTSHSTNGDQHQHPSKLLSAIYFLHKTSKTTNSMLSVPCQSDTHQQLLSLRQPLRSARQCLHMGLEIRRQRVIELPQRLDEIPPDESDPRNCAGLSGAQRGSAGLRQD